MKQTIRHIGMFIFMHIICCALHAQRFTNITLDGAQTVYAIMQDSQGLMWLGTDNGLFSYDGYHSYRHFGDCTVANTRVNALAQQSNMLYLATGNGLQTFDLDTYAYRPGTATAAGAATTRKTPTELRVIDLRHGSDGYGSDVYALLPTRRGLLKGTISGLYLGRRQIAFCPGTQPLVNALAYDAHRRCYWIGTEGALYRADLQLKSFTRIDALNGHSIKCFALAANGTLYIGTDDGLFSMAASGTISHYQHDSHDASSIPNNIVWACYVDKWQNVWIGTDNGLSRLSSHTYYIYTPLYKATLSNEGNCLHALCQTRDGEWWMGGTNGVIRQGKAWYRQNNSQYPLSHNRVRKIYQDREGGVWVCTDHGINLYDSRSGQMRNFIVYDLTRRYSTAWAYDILQDRQGRMWMASYMGGIFVVDRQRLVQTITAATASSSSATATLVADVHLADHGANALSALHVGQLVIDAQGMVWASTGNHVDRINPKTMKVEAVPVGDVVNYLMADARGNVWMGSNGKVRCYVMEGNAAWPVKPREWQIGGKVACMCDVDGRTWVVSSQECCVIGLDGKSFRFKIPQDIMPMTIYYSPTQRQVVMGGNDGYVTLNADAPTANAHPRRLMLAGVMVNGRQLQGAMADGRAAGNDDGSVKTLEQAPRTTYILEIENDENNFTLQLTDLPFSDHPSAVYAYRLEGSDHDWQYMTHHNLDISYNGLPHGSYHLTVHAVDGEGNIGDEVYRLDISILPPWYLSLWAKLVYTLLAAAIAWGSFKFVWVRKRLAEERRQKAEILEQVDARMSFFNRLAEDLKRAVGHRSFDEILDLTNSYLGIQAEKVEIEEPELSPADQRLLKEITEAIEAHMIDSDFNVTTLQEIVGMGGKQLYRKLKAMTGKTPVEYIRDIRMHKAALMLKEGKFSVSEVMYTVGFSNSSYFSKCFSKAYGTTPTEYMKR